MAKSINKKTYPLFFFTKVNMVQITCHKSLSEVHLVCIELDQLINISSLRSVKHDRLTQNIIQKTKSFKETKI